MSDRNEIDHDEQWQARIDIANYIFHQAQVAPEHNVPEWDRGKAFTRDKEPWWRWQGLPALSMACSIFAIFLVLMKVELVIQPEGVLLTFAGGDSNNIEQTAKINDLIHHSINESVDHKINERLNLKLKEFASEQQVVLANYVGDLSVKLATQQQENNLQLASYVIGASRQERKEDMIDFMSYINDQRKNEKLDQTIKFEQLERSINVKNINQKLNSGESGLTLKPANWISQE